MNCSNPQSGTNCAPAEDFIRSSAMMSVATQLQVYYSFAVPMVLELAPTQLQVYYSFAVPMVLELAPDKNCRRPGSNWGPFACEANVITNYTTATLI